MKIGIGVGINYITNSAIANYLAGAMIWGFRSKFKWSQTSTDIWGFANPNDIDPESQVVYDRIIADGGVSDLTRLNYFVVGLKTIYGTLANVPVCYDAHWIGYKLGSGTGATAGQAAAKLYSLTVAGDAVQTTAASQPLLLSHNGADNYWWGSGVSGNYVSTPNAAANQITGDIEIVAYVDYKNNATFQTIISKIIQGTGFCYGLFINASNQIYMSTGNGAIDTPVNSTASLGPTFTGWIRVSRVSSTGLVTFATSTNAPTTNISSISFSSFGTPAIGYIGALGNPNNTVQIGTYSASQLFSFQGKIYRATIANSIGGTPVVDFNPATYNAATSQTQWTSSTGEVWTINTGTATTGYKGCVVSKTIIMSDGIDDNISSTIQMPQYLTEFHAVNQLAFGSNDFISLSGSSLNHLLYNNGTTLRAYNLGNAVNFTSTANLLQIYTSDYAVSAEVRTNNSSINTGILTGSAPSAGKTFFNQGVNYANCILSSYIAASTNLNNTQKTSMYDMLKTMNGL